MKLDEAILQLESDIAEEKKTLAVKERALALLQELARNIRAGPSATQLPTGEAPPLRREVTAPVSNDTVRGVNAAPIHASSLEMCADRDELFQAVRNALEELRGLEFHVGDVHQVLTNSGIGVPGKHPRQLIGGLLEALVVAGELKRSVTGRGRMPNHYKHVR